MRKYTDIPTIQEQASDAKELLNNPIFNHVIREIEAQLLHAWRSTQPGDTTTREICFYRLEALTKISRMIHAKVQDGKFDSIKNHDTAGKPEVEKEK